MKTTILRVVSSAAIATLLLIAPSAASAQTSSGSSTPVANHQMVSANPFLSMFKVFNVEYERRHTGSSTWGVSSSMYGFNDADYRNLNVFYRYYPQGAALSGFYIGGRGGAHRVSVDEASGSFAGLGFELGYTWLLGTERNFAVSMGAGATRLFGGSLNGVSLTVPTLRLVNVGWSF